uniref:Hairy enhancer of split 6 n=1 Tax=Platynereis dumerilii TaxID=6359 RepID=S5TYT5_PLADU|nr:hairy enhancer of split 6 [Platynereis dumerilii]
MPETEIECENASPVHSPTEHRKSTKPIMEKRRRARINASLTELKTLLLDVMKKEGTRHHKMEKADILEMTVKHLRQIQRQQFTVALAEDPTVLDKYQSGFNECVGEVSRYVDSLEGLTPEIRSRLLAHLTKCVNGVSSRSQQVSAASTAIKNLASLNSGPPSPPLLAPKATNVVQDINNNNNCIPNLQSALQGLSVLSNGSVAQAVQGDLNGVRILPNRGNVAFVIPSNMLGGQQVPGYIIPVYTGVQQQQHQQNNLNSSGSEGGQSPKGPSSPTPLVVIPSSLPSPSSSPSSPRSRPSSASGSMPLSPVSYPSASPPVAQDLHEVDTPPSPHRGAFTPVRPQPYTTRPEHRHNRSPAAGSRASPLPQMHPNQIPAHQSHPLNNIQQHQQLHPVHQVHHQQQQQHQQPLHHHPIQNDLPPQRSIPEQQVPLDVSLQRPHPANVKTEHKDDMWRPW